jgi:hypothetical protein
MTVHRVTSVFAGFRFPPEVISIAVRWYLRYGLSYRDVEGHCCIKRSHDHLAGRFIVCWRSVTARQAVRPLLRPCAGRSVNVGRNIYGLMIT